MLTTRQTRLFKKCKGNLNEFQALLEDIVFADTEILFCFHGDGTETYSTLLLDDDTSLDIAKQNNLDIDDRSQIIDYGDDRSEDYVGDIYVDGIVVEDYCPTREELIKYLFFKLSAKIN